MLGTKQDAQCVMCYPGSSGGIIFNKVGNIPSLEAHPDLQSIVQDFWGKGSASVMSIAP